MGKISIDKIRPGMVLEADLVTSDGRLFLPARSTLSDMHIRTCRTWGIAEASIVGVMDEPLHRPQASPERIAAAKKLAMRRFMVTNHRHPAVRELARLYVERMALLHDEGELTAMAEADVPLPESDQHGKLDVDAMLKAEIQLASLPSIFHEITESLNDPRSSAAFIADIIGKDVAISAKLLRLVNTPFYGFPSRVDTLSRAVAIVGVNQLTNLALGISVLTAFEGIPSTVVDLKAFWLHSIMCGTVARLLASHHGILNEERFFVAGLLHDIGRLVMFRNYPDRAMEPLSLGRARKMAQYDAEKTTWGSSHADFGARLLKEWKLPAFLETMLRDHHAPMASPMVMESAIVHVADFVANALGVGSNGGLYVPPLNQEAWESLRVTRHELSSLAEQAEMQANRILQVFFDDEA